VTYVQDTVIRKVREKFKVWTVAAAVTAVHDSPGTIGAFRLARSSYVCFK
jgi:hypothetical protein